MALTTGALVSIITPVYNGAVYLSALIESVREQDYPNIEHIIIDDGSHDNGATVAVLKRYSHLRWWNRENRGQYATMNEGLLAAQGELVCFISADDLMSPGAVSSVMDFMNRHPGQDGVFGITTRIDSQGNDRPFHIPFRTAPLRFYPYFAHISHCSLYVKKASLSVHSLTFNSALKYVGDYDWMIRIYKVGLKIGVLRRELSKVRLHEEQTSRKNENASAAETKQVISKHGINALLFLFLNTLYRLLSKAWLATYIMRHDGMSVFFNYLMSKHNSG